MHCPIFVLIIHHRVTTQVGKDTDIKIQERKVRSISSSLSSVAFHHEREWEEQWHQHNFVIISRVVSLFTQSHIMFPFIIKMIVNFQCFHVPFLFIISLCFIFLMFFLVLLCHSSVCTQKSVYCLSFPVSLQSISHSRKNLISFLEQIFLSLILSFSCCLSDDDDDDDGSCELTLIRKGWSSVVHCMCFHCLCCQLCRVCKCLVWRLVASICRVC